MVDVVEINYEKSVFIPSIDAQLKADALDFLRGASINMGAYLYGDPLTANDPVQGSSLYKALLESEDYYVSSEEAEIIQENAIEIAKSIKNSSVLIDLGPGNEKAVLQKTLPILQSTNSIQSYAPVDINPDYLAHASLAAKRALPNLKVVPIHDDFISGTEGMSFLPPASVLFTGSTLANLTPPVAGRLLQKIRGFIKGGGRLIVGQDINRDEASLSRAYALSLGKALVENIFHRIRRDLCLKDFDPDAFVYRPQWCPEENVYRHVCVSLKEQAFEAHGHFINISKGQEFEVTHSYKYESGFFVQLMEAQGFIMKQCFTHPKGHMALYIFEANPALEVLTSP